MSTQSNYTLAEVLRAARTEKKLSLEQVELTTKIRSSYILALEKSDYSKLPADIYIRGILRNYSAFLGLEYQEILRLYRRDGHVQDLDIDQKKHFLSFKNFINTFVLTSRFVWMVVFFILTSLIFVYIYFSYKSLNTPPNLVVFSPENNKKYSVEEISIHGTTELNTEIRINGQKVSIDEKGSFQEKYDLKEGKNLILIQAVSSRNNQSSQIEREVYYVKEVEKSLKLEVESISDTNLWIIADDKEIFAGQIKAGEKKSFESKDKIKIKALNGQAIFYSIDSAEKKFLSDKKEIAEIEFTKENQ